MCLIAMLRCSAGWSWYERAKRKKAVRASHLPPWVLRVVTLLAPQRIPILVLAKFTEDALAAVYC